ncbi:hypothetical protein TNIN_486201 [Trichonephila inaurata madagascariensis]|uniref:Uncharacterized protein n=1 Tax=Trichonephila inaurata madagascariensis TaxID=2747483 RepID=A0A8X6WNF7_9ARAC|nr:hypothetical protein TNIN_486201 [Trichonephila inaurata madagascariensis]
MVEAREQRWRADEKIKEGGLREGWKNKSSEYEFVLEFSNLKLAPNSMRMASWKLVRLNFEKRKRKSRTFGFHSYSYFIRRRPSHKLGEF